MCVAARKKALPVVIPPRSQILGKKFNPSPGEFKLAFKSKAWSTVTKGTWFLRTVSLGIHLNFVSDPVQSGVPVL